MIDKLSGPHQALIDAKGITPSLFTVVFAVELVAAEPVEGDADDEPALERKQLGSLELGLELGRAGQDEAEQRLGAESTTASRSC